MKPWINTLRTSRATGAFLVLLFGGLAAPSTARAGCGDYVMVTSSQSTDATQTVATEHLSSDMDHATSHRPGRTPCSGPMCSRGSLPPLAPPPAPPAGGETWGCVIPSSGSIVPEGHFASTPNDDARPVGRATTIYHPPRQARSDRLA